MKQLVLKTTEESSNEWIGTETVKTCFGYFEFRHGYPTYDTAVDLIDLITFNRAVETYLMQMPGVSTFHMRKALAEIGARRCNDFVIWETLMDAKTVLLAGHSETVSGMNF